MNRQKKMIKKVLFIFCSLHFSFLFCHAGTLVVEGKYQNKNIYVQNTFAGQGVGFCTYAVYVNGQLTNDEINSTAFEIDLEQYQFKTGDNLSIRIDHKDGCTPPRILNPNAIQPIPSFEITQLRISNEGLLTWTAKNENTSIPYVIEQFRWNKWIAIGELQGTGSVKENNYKFKITTLHSGENRFRLKQAGYQSKYSSEIKFISSSPKCIFSVSKNAKQVDFTCGTLYEVYDFYGSVVKKGYGSRIDIANLQKGNYYVCYDNTIGEVHKR
jgi:hypothetical protein